MGEGTMTRVVPAVLVVVVASQGLAGISRVYRSSGAGTCGNWLLSRALLSSTMCAIHCSYESRCTSFSFEPQLGGGEAAQGTCIMYQEVSIPTSAEQPGATCFRPSDAPGVITVSQSTTTTTSATTTTIPASATPASAIVPTNIIGASRHDLMLESSSSSMCHPESGPIGILLATQHFLICRYSSKYRMLFSTPKTECTNRTLCMDVTCGHGEIMVGFKDNNGTALGPCAKYSSTVSMLDYNDCQTITGPLQHFEKKEYDWKLWRICGGNDEDLYIMTEMHILKNPDESWNYQSATCCRVKLI